MNLKGLKYAITSQSKTKTYWMLQLTGWSSIVFVETINYTFFILGKFQWIYLTQFGFISISGMVVSHFYKKHFIKEDTFDHSLTRIWSKAFTDTLIISLALVIITTAPSAITDTDFFSDNPQQAIIGFLAQIMNFARYVVVWIIIYYLYKIMGKNKEMLEQKLTAEHLATTSELELLKSQLNPHFLFNALNSIKALVLVDSEKSRDAIIKLSELLRFSLNYEKQPFILVAEEMAEVKKYLDLETIRFGRRLAFVIDIAHETTSKKIPPAMVLTLVENAIKHGISKLPDGGQICVRSKIENEHLLIEVANTGTIVQTTSKGIGLSNIVKRLQKIYGQNASVFLNTYEHDSVMATLSIPIN